MTGIQQCGIESIPVIHQLAHAIWPSAYGKIITEDQISYMLHWMYHPDSLKEQMVVKGHQFLLAYNNNQPVGFSSYSPKEGQSAKGIYRLHKLYVLTSEQGKGTGKALLDFIVKDIRPKGATALELNVNKHNPSVGFYLKNGFVITEEMVLDIGNGYVMDDYIMTLAI